MLAVQTLAINNPANTSDRIVRIAVTPWNQVNVGMKYGLPGRFTDVGSDIESGHGPVLRPDTGDEGSL